MMKHASLALIFVLGAALFGSSASAQLLDTSGSVNVNGTASSDNASADVSADASVDAEADVSESEADASEEDQHSSLKLNIERASLDVNTDFAVSDADFVRSAASLESYASATVRADERLESIVLADGRMDMSYRKEARFLWIIPANMTVKVGVSEGGEVSVRYPWYAFLMKTDETRTELEARLAAEVSDINTSIAATSAAELSGASARGGVQASPDIRRWARIIESAYLTVAGNARVNVSTAADA